MTELNLPKSVHEAWADVMADLGGLAKRDRNQHQNFNFRGIDAVMNAVGPVLRTHRVSVVPAQVEHTREQGTTTKGTSMTTSVVNVRYRITGPDGSSMTGQASGEAFDSGDKSMPKAMSVAFRTFLLQALCLPTDEPDPDATSEVLSAVDPAHVEAAEDALDEWEQQAPDFYAAEVAAKRDKLVEYASRGPDYLETVVSRLVREQEAWAGGDA